MSTAQASREERDEVIADAVKAGKFTAERGEHWRRRWAQDPAGIKAGIAAMEPGVIEQPARGMSMNDCMRAVGGRPVEPEPAPEIDPVVDRFIRGFHGVPAVFR